MAKRAVSSEAGQRVPLMARTTESLRAKLDAAAEHSGRSLAQEVEIRLERSFDFEETMERMLSAMNENCDKLVRQAQQHMLQIAGGDDAFGIWMTLAFQVKFAESRSGKTIREDEATRRDVERRILGEIPEVFRNLPDSYSEFSRKATAALAKAGEGHLSPLGHLGLTGRSES